MGRGFPRDVIETAVLRQWDHQVDFQRAPALDTPGIC